jgi:hypothetical protein
LSNRTRKTKSNRRGLRLGKGQRKYQQEKSLDKDAGETQQRGHRLTDHHDTPSVIDQKENSRKILGMYQASAYPTSVNQFGNRQINGGKVSCEMCEIQFGGGQRNADNGRPAIRETSP